MALTVKKNIAFLLTGMLLCPASLAQTGKPETLLYQYKNFTEASRAGSFIHFSMVHRKLGGMMASSFEGVVRRFTVSGEFAGNEFEHADVRFNVLDMDTDNGIRNGIMAHNTLAADQFPEIRVDFGHTLHTGSQTVEGTIQVLGKAKPVQLPITIEDNGKSYKAFGKTSVLMSALGVPRPSFISDSLASVDDKVVITYQLVIPKNSL